MNIDGTGLHRLTTNGRDSYPTWSPDGKQVAFVRPFKDRVEAPRDVLVRRRRAAAHEGTAVGPADVDGGRAR